MEERSTDHHQQLAPTKLSPSLQRYLCALRGLLRVQVFSDWPTIPQLYVAGEFVGGCDIVTSQYKSGELKELLQEHKLIS